LRKIILNKQTLNYILSFFLILLFHTLLDNLFNAYYKFPDGSRYKFVFETVSNFNFINGYFYFISYTGGSEPISYLLFYIFSIFCNFYFFNILLNTILTFFIFKLFKKYHVNTLYGILFFFTNFYILVLFYGAFRLKIGILFWIISLYTTNIKTQRFFSIVSVLSHFQILIIYINNYLSGLLKSFKITLKLRKIFLYSICTFTIILILPIILPKIYYYINYTFGNKLPYKFIVLFLYSFFLILNSKEFFINSIFYLFFVFIFGDERINILYFFTISLFFILNYKRKSNLSFIFFFVLILYFTIKGIQFSTDMINGIDYFTK
jgi:hypothetical protein